METVQRIPMTTSGQQLLVAARSDIGCVRKRNEDSLGVFPAEDPHRGSLLVVADGMGGAAAGEVASGIAVEVTRDRYFAAETAGNPAERLRSAIVAANDAIHRRAAEDPHLGGMGTTLTAAAVVAGELWLGHVGDSRAYLIRDGEIHQLTKDHSLAAELDQRDDPGARRRAKSVLTRCLGVKPEVEVDVSESSVPLSVGAALLLCSDGLSNVVETDDMLHLVAMHVPESACRRLVELSLERGAPDNVTVVIARVSPA